MFQDEIDLQNLTTTTETLHVSYPGKQKEENVTAVAILFAVTSIGCLGNCVAISTIIICRKFRKSSTAFLCHQCLLDLVKGFYSFLYGHHLLHGHQVSLCNLVGVTYLLLVTVSAYNLIGIVVNEEYELQSPPRSTDKNKYCIMFGLSLIWFTCLLLNMGVVFLPQGTEYIRELGTCTFAYGSASNFVLRVLWMLLITIAILFSLFHFISMYRRIRFKDNDLKLIDDIQARFSEDLDLEAFQNIKQENLYDYLYLRRVIVLLLMVVTFIIFWYPLFILILVDHRFQQPISVYKTLTLLTWCHPATTPLFTFYILYDMCKKDGLMRRLYSNIYPMLQFYNHSMGRKPWETMDSGIYNSYFGADGQPLSEQEMAERAHLMQGERRRNIVDHTSRLSVDGAETQIKIEQWDSSPTSPGKRRKSK